MSYLRRNGRIFKPLYMLGGHVYYWDCGPAPPLRRFDRALLVMSYFENRDRTESRWYSLAREVAIGCWRKGEV